MNNLYLVLKNPWFDMIKSGEKKEEYRELTNFWKTRLEGKSFDTLEFVHGYPSREDMSKRLFFKNPKIRIGEGNPVWGAEPGKQYYIITWE